MMNPYIGHSSQLYGVEETRLVGGKGDGMRLLQARNATGLAFTVAADRCADVYRLSFKGINMGYFSPNGYVAPAFYQEKGKGFLKSFTAGFFTTCGLNNVGAPSVDGAEELPQHGTIGNTPAERIWWTETEDTISVHAIINDSVIFGRKLVLCRTLTCGKFENWLEIHDTVENQGDREEPVLLMYHINMGYPLLTEQAVLEIPSEHVETGTTTVEDDRWRTITPPVPRNPEICYRHYYEGMEQGSAAIFNPQIERGLKISFRPEDFPSLVQWSKFSCRDYALGLETRSFRVGGRAKARERGDLYCLPAGESRIYRVRIDFFEKL